jgi:ubiquinone/menaquinone biosynthesis C-methylase UbiE
VNAAVASERNTIHGTTEVDISELRRLMRELKERTGEACLAILVSQSYPAARSPMHAEEDHLERNARKWDARAETYDQTRFDYFRWMQRKALGFLDLKAGIRFLDLGCGTGYAVRYVAAEAKHEGLFCGIDISPRMIEIAREKSSGFKSMRFEVANAEELPFGADSFNAVVCTNSFHHYAHPSTTLAEVRRVLRTGGRFCILDVTADNFLVQWIDSRVRLKEPEHVRFYSTVEYTKMFEETGLTCVISRTLLPSMRVHVAQR